MIRFLRRFFGEIDLTPKELAELLAEVLIELKEEGMDRTDWLLEALERMETNLELDYDHRAQSIRAELYRKGFRHSKAEA
jgi:hypothetical protein